jgi:hypothetical protein
MRYMIPKANLATDLIFCQKNFDRTKKTEATATGNGRVLGISFDNF